MNREIVQNDNYLFYFRYIVMSLTNAMLEAHCFNTILVTGNNNFLYILDLTLIRFDTTFPKTIRTKREYSSVDNIESIEIFSAAS